jgi:hypothetical protein
VVDFAASKTYGPEPTGWSNLPAVSHAAGAIFGLQTLFAMTGPWGSGHVMLMFCASGVSILIPL